MRLREEGLFINVVHPIEMRKGAFIGNSCEIEFSKTKENIAIEGQPPNELEVTAFLFTLELDGLYEQGRGGVVLSIKHVKTCQHHVCGLLVGRKLDGSF